MSEGCSPFSLNQRSNKSVESSTGTQGRWLKDCVLPVPCEEQGQGGSSIFQSGMKRAGPLATTRMALGTMKLVQISPLELHHKLNSSDNKSELSNLSNTAQGWSQTKQRLYQTLKDKSFNYIHKRTHKRILNQVFALHVLLAQTRLLQSYWEGCSCPYCSTAIISSHCCTVPPQFTKCVCWIFFNYMKYCCNLQSDPGMI